MHSHETSNSDTSPTHSIPIHYSALKVAHKKRRIPVLHEKDIEESFVRGELKNISFRFDRTTSGSGPVCCELP